MDESGKHNTVDNNKRKKKTLVCRCEYVSLMKIAKPIYHSGESGGESMLSAVEKQKPKIVMIVTANVCYASPI